MLSDKALNKYLSSLLHAAVFCRIHERPRPPTLATTSRQLPAAGLEEAAPRRRESVPFQRLAPARGSSRTNTSQTARSRRASRHADAAAPVSQEARDEAPGVSLVLGTSPPPSPRTAALDGASDGPLHTPGRHTA
ncbi:hypothetical protein B0H14DRAFT_3485056 [Mycena olivaceomarginata]|nr:hypothetical protein B0H14DRAFT_3485056 [Mycena olivaceomarginata]